jgi:hypothetical protein
VEAKKEEAPKEIKAEKSEKEATPAVEKKKESEAVVAPDLKNDKIESKEETPVSSEQKTKDIKKDVGS